MNLCFLQNRHTFVVNLFHHLLQPSFTASEVNFKANTMLLQYMFSVFLFFFQYMYIYAKMRDSRAYKEEATVYKGNIENDPCTLDTPSPHF